MKKYLSLFSLIVFSFFILWGCGSNSTVKLPDEKLQFDEYNVTPTQLLIKKENNEDIVYFQFRLGNERPNDTNFTAAMIEINLYQNGEELDSSLVDEMYDDNNSLIYEKIAKNEDQLMSLPYILNDKKSDITIEIIQVEGPTETFDVVIK